MTSAALAVAGCASTVPPSAGDLWRAPDKPGAALALTEVGRSGAGFATIATYALAASGLPAGEGYQVVIRRADGTSAVPINDVVVGPTGEVRSRAGNAGETVPIAINAKALAPGEPIEIRASSAALGTQATAEITPRPLVSSTEGHCQLTARLERRPTLAYRVVLSGFEPKEPVEVSIKNQAGKSVSTRGTGTQVTSIPLRRLLEEPTSLSIVAASLSCRAEAVADFTDVPR